MLFSSAEFAHGVFFCGRCRMNFEKIGLYPASTAYDANSWSIEKPTLAKGNSTAPTFRMTASQTVTRSSTFTRNVQTAQMEPPTGRIRAAGISMQSLIDDMQNLRFISPGDRIHMNQLIDSFKSIKLNADSSVVEGVLDDMGEIIARVKSLRLNTDSTSSTSITSSTSSTSTSASSYQHDTAPVSPGTDTGPTTPVVLFPLGARPWDLSRPRPSDAVYRSAEVAYRLGEAANHRAKATHHRAQAAIAKHVASIKDQAERLQWVKESSFLLQRVRARGICSRNLWDGVLIDYNIRFPDQHVR